MDGTHTAPIAFWIGEHFYWVMIGILVLNLMQRRHQKQAEKKRFATLYLAIAIFCIYAGAQLIVNYGGRDPLFFAITAVVLAVVLYFRKHTFPFRLRSTVDGRRLSWQEILFDDLNGDGNEEKTNDATEETPE